MQPYNRAKQKQLNLQSVNYYTNVDPDENHERVRNRRPIKRRTFFRDREDHGKRERHSSRDGSKDRSAAVQRQQSDARQIRRDVRFLNQDGGSFGARGEARDQEGERLIERVPA